MIKPQFKIAHILHSGSVMGGTEHATLRISKAVERYGFGSTAFCPREEPPSIVKDSFDEAGLETDPYDAVEPSYRHPTHFLQASFDLARNLKRREIDLVHCCDVSAAFYAAFAGRLAGLPVLCHVRNAYPDLSRRDQSFLYAVNRFAFVSRETWNRFGYKISKHRGVVIYDGIDVSGNDNSRNAREEICRQYDIPANAKIVGMVARVAAQKDYVTLAKAAVRVIAAHNNVRFLIVGDNSGIEPIRQHYAMVDQILSDSGIRSHFIFTGHQTDVDRYLEAMDVFALSTHTEGLPLVLLEAMAKRKPVVATSVDGVPEIIRHGKTGFLFPHSDDVSFADQLLRLLRNDELSNQIGEAGCQEVKTNWTGERFGWNVANLYSEMLGLKSEPLRGDRNVRLANRGIENFVD